MTIEIILRQYDFNLKYAFSLVADLSEDQMTIVPANGLDNHPAFTLGHLVSGSAMMAEDLGAPLEMPEQWAELFLRKGPGDPRKPDPDTSKYPSKEALLKELEHQHHKVAGLLKQATPDRLGEKIEWRFQDTMPAVLDLAAFMCITHEAMHLGQLAAWRRAMGLGSALAAMA